MVRVLSFHAPWRCQHTGRCCTSNWPIPISTSEAARLDDGLRAGRLAPAPADAPAVESIAADSLLMGRRHGRCVFHDRHAAGGCRIQRALGHDALPMACRQFPRVSVRHPGGVSVTLSHYCPSARALLDDAGPVSITHGAPAFPVTGEYVGLTADPEVPPLLHPRVLLDWDAWWLIETRAVTLLTEQDWAGLTRLGIGVERLRGWSPGQSRLTDAVHGAFDMAGLSDAPAWRREATADDHIAAVLASIPDEWHAVAQEALAAPAQALPAREAGRFLAAHAFANWAAYNGRGLRTWYRAIETAAALLAQTGDPGAVDLLLRHLADPGALIARWDRLETRPVIPRP